MVRPGRPLPGDKGQTLRIDDLGRIAQLRICQHGKDRPRAAPNDARCNRRWKSPPRTEGKVSSKFAHGTPGSGPPRCQTPRLSPQDTAERRRADRPNWPPPGNPSNSVRCRSIMPNRKLACPWSPARRRGCARRPHGDLFLETPAPNGLRRRGPTTAITSAALRIGRYAG